MAEYEAYKDSGAVWLGRIPAEWKTGVIGSLYTLRNTKVSDTEYPPLSVTMRGVVPQLENAAKTDAHDARKLVCKGDFAINSRSDRRGSCGVSDFDGSVSLINTVLTPRDSMNPQYYNWLFHTVQFADEFYKQGRGIVDDLWTTRWNEMKRILIPVPTADEQTAIAEYLAKEITRIDIIIAEAKASIEEYKAWKASIIYEAVTKGLNTDVELADSGIDYIGRIPKHWKLTSLKRICTRISDGSHFSPETTNEGYPYVTAGDVHGKGIDYCRCRNISEEAFDALVKAGCRPQKGDVLLVKDGATTGRVGLMTDDEPCVLLSSVAMLTPNDTVFSEYLMRLIESEVLQFQIRKSMAGSAMPRTTLTKLQSYTVIDCPYAEQVQIAKYLDVKCEMIDKLIAEKEKLLLDLEAYKKSLIFEVVTGKRKVV